MSTKSKLQQPAVTKTPKENQARIVGKFNSKYKDVIKLTGLMKKKK